MTAICLMIQGETKSYDLHVGSETWAVFGLSRVGLDIQITLLLLIAARLHHSMQTGRA
jgi:hypothetical protein